MWCFVGVNQFWVGQGEIQVTHLRDKVLESQAIQAGNAGVLGSLQAGMGLHEAQPTEWHYGIFVQDESSCFLTCSCLGHNKGAELILGSQSLALSQTNGHAEGLLSSAVYRRVLSCSCQLV